MRIGLSKYLANKLKSEFDELFPSEGSEVIFDRSIGKYEFKSSTATGGYQYCSSQRTALETLGRIPVNGKEMK